MDNALVVYDSVFGNTKLVAQAMADAISEEMSVELLPVQDVKNSDLQGLNLLIVGSPTRQFRATPATIAWIKSLAPSALNGVNAAAFDTRIPEEQLKSNKALNFFSWMIAYGADPISKNLLKKGAHIIAAPQGFYVKDTEGPLVDGELKRAGQWAYSLINKIK